QSPAVPRRLGRATMGPRLSVWLLLLPAALLLHEEHSRAAAKGQVHSLGRCSLGVPVGYDRALVDRASFVM
ncbi:hypothetical protein H8959_014237, partial [Pygathrix nigripes]